MSYFVRFFIFAGGLIIGLMILKYMERIVYTLGRSEWAETKFGAGGTYKMWQYIATGIIVITVLLAFFG